MSNEGLDEKTQEFGGKYFGEGEDESGTENDRESFPVENDGKTSSSNKRIKEMPIDGFSELPDSLLIHILSFLRLKEAAITSVLSKRWRFLWSYLPRLEFWEGSADTEKLRRFVSWVHRTLVIRTGNYLEKFEVGFRYDKCFASDLDFCVEFVVKNKVKEFILLLDFYKDFYMLPEVIYSNSSLTSLRLQGCMMAPERTIEWQSLTKLSLNEVELDQHAIEEILSGCPVLYSLELESCWGFNRLEVNSRSLYRLTIEDSEDDDEPLLEISAPYIQTLDILLYPEGRKLQLRNIPSLVRADIDFNGYGWDSSSVEVMSYLKELFENMQHVKELVLGRQCFKVVSMLAVNGWQLPQSRRRCLSVYSSSEYKHNISGIIYLLESSPDLEALIIEGYFTYRKYPTLDPAAKGDLDCDLLHLKTVNIRNFADPKGEPLLTLARILLKRATVLEEMVIVTDVKDTSDFSKIGQTLLAYPRSSQKAVVSLLNDRAVVMPEEFIRRHCTCLVVV